MSAATQEQIVLTNAVLFTGTSEEAIQDGAVWVDGEIIRYAGPAADLPAAAKGVRHKDVGGKFIMPGMTESHSHLSFTDAGPFTLGQYSSEETMLIAVGNARKMLGVGFTSAISFGSAHKIDIYLKSAIESGRIPGPRLRPGGRDIGTTASNVDSRGNLSMIGDSPWALRKIVRDQRFDEVEIVKIFLDGEGISRQAPVGELSFSDEEVAAVVEEAHRHGMRVATHSRSADSVKQAVRHGCDLIGHANYVDDEAMDMLKKVKDKVYIGPAIAWEMAFLANLEDLGFEKGGSHDLHYSAEVEATKVAMKRFEEAGIKTLIGGDYGIGIAPHGAYAKDLQYFVELFDMTPGRALLCATRDGGAAADPEGMIGTLEEGKYADLIVVDGNPLKDVTVLQDHDKITAVMKGGHVYVGLTNSDPYSRSANDVFGDASPASAPQPDEVLEPAQ